MLIPDDVTVVALGRQALGLAARQARADGRRTVLVPEFSCQTMVAPWQLEGMSVRLVPVGPDLLMRADGLAAELARCRRLGERPVVLHCQTFGICASAELRAVLESACTDGAAVVVDRTHSFLRDQLIGRPARAGVTEIVSTRKLLPVPEISWITGAGRTVETRADADDRLTRARQDYLQSPSVAAFEAAEDLADDAWVPVGPHADALRAVAGFDAERLAGMVLATRRRIGQRVPGLDVVNRGTVCPLVVRIPEVAEELADRLHERGLVGPLHWDRPENLPSGTDWPSDLLCLPAVLDDDGLEIVAQVLSRAV